MKTNRQFTTALWLLPLVMCGLSLAAQMFSVEHAGFRVAASVMDSVITPVSPTPEPPADTPIPPTEAPPPPPTHPPDPPQPTQTTAPAQTPLPPICTATPLPPSATPGRAALPPRARTLTPTPALPSTPTSPPAVAPPTVDAIERGNPRLKLPSATIPLPPGIKYVVRAEHAIPGPEPARLIHVCVFDTAPMPRTLPTTTETQPTPTTSPTPGRWRVVAADIRIVIQVQEPARILGGWSDSSRADLTTHTLSFHTPALHKSETVRYAAYVEADTSGAWRVQVSDARGPAIDLSGDPAIQCDSSGLFTTLPEASAQSTPVPAPSESIAWLIPAVAARDRATPLRADTNPREPGISADHTHIIVAIIAAISGLACLTAAVFLWRHQQRNRRPIPGRQIPR